MEWEVIENLIEESIEEDPPQHLLTLQIGSSSRRNPYFTFFRNLAKFVKPRGVFLEIGSYHGVVAAHFCEDAALHNHVMAGIDLNDVPFSHPRFRFFKGDSKALGTFADVKEFADANGGIYAVFQDSSHHYEASVLEWRLYSPLVRPGGIWVADDLTPAFQLPTEPKGQVEYFDELPGDKRLYQKLHFGSTMGIVRM